MHTDSSTSKTDGIYAFASFYMSVCCRTEVFLNSGEPNPCCPDCNRLTEWVIVLRRGCSVAVPTQRVELRRSIRYPVTDGDLLVVCLEPFSRAENARVLNVSERGMAIEIPGPAKILSEIKLLSRERNFAQVGRSVIVPPGATCTWLVSHSPTYIEGWTRNYGCRKTTRLTV